MYICIYIEYGSYSSCRGLDVAIAATIIVRRLPLGAMLKLYLL